jgi:serine/threonine-protein kinase
MRYTHPVARFRTWGGRDGAVGAAGEIRPGQVLAGRYRIDRVLGSGGMGIVVAAEQVHLGQKVAIKFLRGELARRPEAVSRFVREAKAGARLRCQHVARVLDVATLDSGAPYLVMELLDGITMADWLDRHGPLSVDRAIDVIRQAGVAVAEAHALGIVHRDLKPANLFSCARSGGEGIIKVLDFGISKLAAPRAAQSVETLAEAFLGSPHYMSPEQMRSARDVDARADVWALGVTLYELLTGELPFPGTALTEVAVRVATQAPEPLRGRRPKIPPELDAAVARCLEKDPSDRYASVEDLLKDLSRCPGARASTPTEPAPLRARIPSQTLDETGSMPAMAGDPARGRRRVAPGVALTVAVSLAGFAFAAFAALHPSAPREPTVRSVNAAGPAGEAVAASELSTPAPPVAAEPPPGPGAFQPEPEPAAAPALAGPASMALGSRTVGAEPRRESRLSGATKGAPPSRAAPSSAAPSAPAIATSHPKPNCDPPYSIDRQGNRIFRPECVE